jgi:DnaK suppressor protein
MKTEPNVHDPLNAAGIQNPAEGEAQSMTLLDEAHIRSMPEAEYMNEAMLAFFRHRLTEIAKGLLDHETHHGEEMREHEYAADPVDRASQEETHSLGLLTRVRQTRLYTEVRQAIARIDSGDFGWCSVTGEPIGVPRLLAWPTATMTVDQQDRLEKRSRTFAPAQ